MLLGFRIVISIFKFFLNGGDPGPKNSKLVWPGNTAIKNCRETYGIVRKSHTAIASHQEDKQEGQVALNRSPEFCLKLTYRNLLKADHFPGDTWGKQFLVPRALFEQTLKRFTS